MTDTATDRRPAEPHTSGLRIGTAPDSWGVWFAEDPRQTPWDRFLDEVQAAGYHWIELGPYGYLPTDPAQLLDELAKRDLRISGGTVFTGFHKGADQWDRAVEQVEKVAALTRAVGGEHIVVIPDLWRSDATGETLEPRLGDFREGVVMTRFFSQVILEDVDGALEPLQAEAVPEQT